MVTLKPFKAVRPAAGLEKRIAALPYDVYNRAEAKEVVSRDDMTFLAIDRAESMLPDDVDTYDDKVYKKAASLLSERIEKGYFIREEEPCFYLYELVMDGRSQAGFVGLSMVDEYIDGTIKIHENTLAAKEEDRVRHVYTCSAQTGPIFLAYRDNDELASLQKKIMSGTPIYDFTSDDGITHRVWRVSDSKLMSEISGAFEGLSGVYIADGHHRCASAVRVSKRKREENPENTGFNEYDGFLSVSFPDSQLKILDYNRVVKDLNGLSEEEFLDRLKQDFAVEKVSGQYSPAEAHSFGMFLGEEWYSLKYKGDVPSDPVKSLDVSILQERLLTPVLGIGDPKTDKRIEFIGGIRGLSELERRCHADCAVAFAMHPTSMQELFAVADARLLMPPKSTWFEPKLRSGLFIHEI